MMAVGPKRVKPSRVSPRPQAPFGAGLLRSLPSFRLDRTAADESWLADQAAGADGWPDLPWDEMARQAAWDAQWEAAMVAESRCAACGLVTDELTAGLCDRCALAIDADLDADPDNGGTCQLCQRHSDYRDAIHGLCPVCQDVAEEASTACQTGLRRVY